MRHAKVLEKKLWEDYAEISEDFKRLDIYLSAGDEESIINFCNDVMENVQILTIDGQIAKAPLYIGLYLYELNLRVGVNGELDKLKIVLQEIRVEEIKKLGL